MSSETAGKIFRRSSSHWGTFRAEIRNNRMVAIEPFHRDSEPSPVLDSIVESVYADNRVPTPMVRSGWLERGPQNHDMRRGADPFVPVSWERALALVADELRRVKERYGNEAIFGGSYGWGSAGRFHHANYQLYRFLNGFGGFTEKTESYSFAAGTVIMPYVVGSSECVVGRSTSWDSMLGNTRLMVMFGGLPLKNTQMEYGGVGSHSAAAWLRRIKAAGTEFVSIALANDDAPHFLEADWLAPRPNTDTALMLGLAHSLVADGLHDEAFLERYCVGFDRFCSYLTGKTDGKPKDANWAAAITGIEAQVIRDLARRMATRRTMITMSWALQRADHGEQTYWMATALAAMLGQIGLPGGGVGFGYCCEAGMGSPRERIPVPTLPAGSNPTRSSIPVARVSDMLLNPGATYEYKGQTRTYPDIRLVYWCGGNPFHHHQDINRLLRAWQAPDTVIVHEPWWTAAARHADIVLPATTAYERMDIAYSSRDRFILAMDQLIDPVGEARNDHSIFAELAGRLGFETSFTEGRSPQQWVRYLYDCYRENARLKQVTIPEFDEFWDRGYVEIPEPSTPFVLFEDFRRDPAHHPLQTPSGKIEIYSETIAGYGYDDCPPHPTWLEPAEWLGGATAHQYPLHLISNQPRTRLHGQTDGVGASRASKVKGREPIWIHPDDAAARDIHDGDVVRVFNARGEVLAGAVVTAAIRRNVVQLAVGATFDPERPGHPGSRDKHGNVNMLTLDKGTSKLAQGPSSHTALVEIERFEGELPTITAFTQPAIVSDDKHD